MNSRFYHLLLPVSLRQLSYQFFLCFLADFRMKSSIETLSPYKRAPAWRRAVEISSPSVGRSINFQVTPFPNNQTDHFLLLISRATAQTGSLWTVPPLRHASAKAPGSLFPRPMAPRRPEPPLLARPLVPLAPIAAF